VAATEAWTDTSFPAMGSRARVLAYGGPADLADRARARLLELEARWSRFVAASELSRLNAAQGAPVVVSADTFDVIQLAIAAWRETEGRFDPTVIDALEAAGYDRTFADVPPAAAARAARPARVPGCGGIRLDRIVRSVRLPSGVRLDLGGIGKGRAADLIAAELLDAGAAGVCVDLGGDLRLAGGAPQPAGWRVQLDPSLAPARSLLVAAGGVATSTRVRRHWSRGDEDRHHLIDPGSGRPAWTGLRAVTVVADTTAWAEILAKAAFVAGPEAGSELLAAHGVTGLLVRDDGQVEALPGLAELTP
jgi:thiamine biosynthesis lipoprotein